MMMDSTVDFNASIGSSSGAGKKYTAAKHTTVANKHPVQVQRRNARERNRVRQVNNGFNTLKNIIPLNGKQKKLSKVETLRQASKYIHYLNEILGGREPSTTVKFEHPMSPTHSVRCPSAASSATTGHDFKSEPCALPGQFDCSSSPDIDNEVDADADDDVSNPNQLCPSFTAADFDYAQSPVAGRYFAMPQHHSTSDAGSPPFAQQQNSPAYHQHQLLMDRPSFCGGLLPPPPPLTQGAYL